MKTKLTLLLSLTFLFLFSGSVYGDDFQDGVDAYKRKDYKTAYKLLLPFAEQGDALAQKNLGLMYYKGQGVPQDYVKAHMWARLDKYSNTPGMIQYTQDLEKKMSPSQIEEAQEMARNWKPKK
jgi:TPR repeat protein